MLIPTLVYKEGCMLADSRLSVQTALGENFIAFITSAGSSMAASELCCISACAVGWHLQPSA